MQKKPNQNQAYDEMAKLALIGDSSVGKTNILLHYIHSEASMQHVATIGIDFKVKMINIDGFKLKLQIWDTAGQQRFRNLTGTVYHSTQAILLVYSVTDRKTFVSLAKWIQDVHNNAPPNVIIALAGNKVDLQSERVVSFKQGQEVASNFGNCIFFQTSAKDGKNINQLFDTICKKIKDKLIKKSKQSRIKNKIKDQNSSEVKNNQRSTEKPVKLKHQTKHEKQKKKGFC